MLALDPGLPVSDVRTMNQIVADAMAPARFTMLLLSIFAGVALALAIIGIYGLLSYGVSRHRREIGVRIALGAPASSVLSLVVWKGMRLTLPGLGAGVATAMFLTRLLESLLYGARPLDPATLLFVPALVALVALAATYNPARRAAAVDPMLALWHE